MSGYEPDDENEDLDDVQPITAYLVQGEPESNPLRWTPLTAVIDLFDTTSDVMTAIAGFFSRQALSMAHRASLREELEDRQIKQRLRTESRVLMRLETLEDIDQLPAAGTE
jgi:hypothetical protein